MFKRFDPSSDISTSTQVKSSVQRSIKLQLVQSHEALNEELIDLLIPKKPPLVQYKIGPHLLLYCRPTAAATTAGSGSIATHEPIAFQHRDGPILPTLRFCHKYPQLEFTRVTVDRGAIPYLLGGANVMCPGLTSQGGQMPPDLPDNSPGLSKGDGVVIYAEGKELPLAVGCMTMSSRDIREKNRGTGIEVCHYLGDGLWSTEDIH